MKIYSEGFRRVTAEGEFEANQNSKLKFGVLISVACIGSLAFTSKAEGVSFTPNNAGGKSEVQILADFKDWACNVLTDPTLCDQYGNTTNLDDIDIDDLIEFKDSNNIEDAVQGDLTLFSKIEVSHVIEHRTIDSTIDINSYANCEVEFTRQATSQISLTFDGGSANWESPVVWENMDVYWDAPEGTNTPYLAKVYERDASSSISLSASVGTADYASSVFWEFMDVNWDDEDTSTGNQFFSTVHNRNASAGISISTTVGQAGWASDFVWEGLDINWDDNIAGQIHQGNATASISLNASSSSIETDLETRTASCTISLSTNVTGDIDTIFAINASSQFSLSTNINSEIIAGWNSDTTLIENLTRNWETS